MADTEKKRLVWWKKLIIIVLAAMLVLFLLIAGLSVAIYESFFGVRYETYVPLGYNVSDFDGLMRAEYDFTSDKGQNLAGYLYHNDQGNPHGVIVLAHGFGGGGHNSYMDCINYFVKNGYYVFTYDATGNDESEGDSVGGLPQGVIDLQYALNIVKEREEFEYLPIMLIGHSWGGYSVTNVLKYHPDVKAVVSMAGFDASVDLLQAQGEMMAGEGAMNIIRPFMYTYESIKYGEYAGNTAVEGFEASDAAVMVIHSDDDTTVPQKYGYDIWYEIYKDNPRFVFVQLTGQGHDGFLSSAQRKDYIDRFNGEFDKWYAALPENITEDEFIQLKAEYISENLDREIWCNTVNEELFAEILAFYEANID